MRVPLPLETLRAQFPAFSANHGWAFMENAGGSQVPFQVPAAISQYMSDCYVQLGAGYAMANKADEVVRSTHEFEELLMNARPAGKVVLGPSTSLLFEQLAQSFTEGGQLTKDHEVLVSQAAHEANKGPWVRAAERVGASIKVWPFDPTTCETCPLGALDGLLSAKTRVVAIPHVSNLLGEVVPVEAIIKRVRERAPNAAVVVDGVAAAPHLAIDCSSMDCDFYAYSHYKVFGPHMASLYGKMSAFARLKGPNHFFIKDDAVPYKWELGCLPHELCAGRLAFKQYLNVILDRPVEHAIDRPAIVAAFQRITEMEQALTDRVHSYLEGAPGVTVYSHRAGERVPTISFTHAHLQSAEIARRLHEHKIAVRHGHMYAYDLVKAMGIRDVEDGVVRISMLHYNTPVEVDRLLNALTEIIASASRT